MKKLSFTIEGIPPAYNKACKINYGRRNVYLTQSARNFKTKVKLNVPAWELDDQDLVFQIHNKYYSNWYYKNGKPKKKDVQNMNRLLIDAIFSALGKDDSLLWRVTDEKVQCEDEEFTHVTLEVINVDQIV
jgi:Holliday junction resolvase RusA-like endonuclease